MACYDCEDCSINYQKGGKCKRWEYDCPFSHLRSNNEEEQIKKNEDLGKALKIKEKLEEVKALWDSMNFSWNYDTELCYINSIIRELEDKLDEDLIREWNEIKSK